MKENKILDGLLDAVTGDMARVTFVGVDLGSGDKTAVICPRCSTPYSWSAPIPAPGDCWNCGLEFRYR